MRGGTVIMPPSPPPPELALPPFLGEMPSDVFPLPHPSPRKKQGTGRRGFRSAAAKRLDGGREQASLPPDRDFENVKRQVLRTDERPRPQGEKPRIKSKQRLTPSFATVEEAVKACDEMKAKMTSEYDAVEIGVCALRVHVACLDF